MSELTVRLRAEHKALTLLLEEVRGLGPTAEGLKKLNSAKSVLLAHLKLEDVELYPVLNKAAETDYRLKTTLDLFAKDMQEISKFAMDFFTKYANGAAKEKDFAKDFEKLCSQLSARIRKEERTLHSEYDRVQSLNKKAA